ncbi:hypothetical protein JTE90_015971 [Oedothorax gibbosus]|uniref:Uncharacterized protein n=1 Tax=Oedothorax gibbosus TaxID=931172 RepID=A0AAV6VRK9_9ARAC|nr:hypothetical protein JTE90_015971 [Oedothorax gibbosus]
MTIPSKRHFPSRMHDMCRDLCTEVNARNPSLARSILSAPTASVLLHQVPLQGCFDLTLTNLFFQVSVC